MARHITTPPLSAWAQVTDDALHCTSDSTTMVRTYKLPASCCTNILNSIKTGASLELVESWIRTAAGSLDVGVAGAKFTPLAYKTWGLNRYQLQQIEAGQYMILKCWFQYTGIDIDGLPDEPWSEETSLGQSVSWQVYSVSPYIYCNEVEHNDVPAPSTGQMPEPSGKNALRRHIEMAITQNAQNSENYPYKWGNSTNDFQLTVDEIAIWKKVAAGVNPVFHKPVVTQSWLYRTNTETSVPENNNKLDQISSPPASVPEWTGSFIYCGRTWTKSQQTYYSNEHPEGVTIYTMAYTDTWEGALEPDQDFYGANAWKFHEGPSGNGGN